MEQKPQSNHSPSNETGSFLGKWEWAAFWVATLVAFGVYYYSLAPSVTMEDSGELATAGDHLGIPHPPGYPLWTIIAWLFAKALWFVEFRGQPDPAWCMGLASAVFGALASGITAMLICRSGKDMLSTGTYGNPGKATGINNLIAFAGGVAASLMFAFCPVMWSQSNIVEVYSLNAFFVAIILLLAYAWLRRPSDKLLFAISLAFGLGMGDWWPTVLLTLGPLAILVLLRDIKLFRSFCMVGAVIVGMIFLNTFLGALNDKSNPTGESLYPWAGTLLWLNGPYSVAFWAYFAVNCAAIFICWHFMPRGRTVAICFILVELGLLIYLYMPLASDLRNPPMNWGYPRTWEGFIHAVSRGQYEKLSPTDVFTPKFVDQLGWYLASLRGQFTLPLCLTGFLTFIGWSITTRNRRVGALLPCLVLAVFASVLVGFENFGEAECALTVPLLGHDIRLYMPMIAAILVLLVLGFAALVLTEIKELIQKLGDESTRWPEKLTIGLVLLSGTIVLIIYEWNMALLLSDKAQALSQSGKIIVIAMMFMPLVLAGGIAWLMYGRLELEFDFDRNSKTWIIVTVVAFFLMGIIMVVGSNLQGDIQDMFIQKVKFISSYELFSFWLGYGLILGLAHICRFFAWNRFIAGGGVCLILLMPVYQVVETAPFVRNGFNREMLRVEGGANARGSDYGWQFGCYQLRGVKAILEELKPGEPRPPSPAYPPPMGNDAIFFGGTDPGRFVPTYMIYSAHVREDVYLITQNALADHTYMSVMRDLYGDRIWIPATADNNEAFRMYADEVRDGRRHGNVDVHNGRVVVQGVEQVMAINAILCKMIHDRNKWRHPFYVEESYVMPWMYPYMEPHGLILKLNAEPLLKIPDHVVKDDMEFWAWYVRRMLRDVNFTEDAVARKTFSKLRCAIAGLYEHRQLWDKAECAYQQAIMLCPVSPEAVFRLVNMYMMLGRFDDAKKTTRRFVAQDSNNRRAFDLIRQIDDRRNAINRLTELERQVGSGGGSLQVVMELAASYRAMGNIPRFMMITRSIIDNPQVPVDAQMAIIKWYCDLKAYDDMDRAAKLVIGRAPSNAPPEVRPKIYRSVAELYAIAQKLPEALDALRRYVSSMPLDYQGWHEFGVLSAHLGKTEDALVAFQQAVRIAGNKEREDLRKDSRLAPLRSNQVFQQISRAQ